MINRRSTQASSRTFYPQCSAIRICVQSRTQSLLTCAVKKLAGLLGTRLHCVRLRFTDAFSFKNGSVTNAALYSLPLPGNRYFNLCVPFSFTQDFRAVYFNLFLVILPKYRNPIQPLFATTWLLQTNEMAASWNWCHLAVSTVNKHHKNGFLRFHRTRGGNTEEGNTALSA